MYMKKKLTLIAFALIATASLWAQDIIVTRDAQKIEAKILEVSKTEIKYKEKDNQNGPTFVLETKEIGSIIYSNGKVVVYNQETAATTCKETEDKSAQVSKQIEAQTIKATSEKAASTSTSSTSQSGRIYRDNGSYMYNDTYISSREVVRILQKENKSAYKQWQKADGMSIGGAVCSGVGLGLALGSIYPFIYRNKAYTSTEFSSWTWAGIGLVSAGGVCAIVGVGLLIGANAQYNKAIDIYNSKYDQAAVQLQWHVAPTEVGLALVF